MTKEVEAELQEQICRQRRWEAMTPEQKKKQLFLNQKELLDIFLVRHAIFQWILQFDLFSKNLIAPRKAILNAKVESYLIDAIPLLLFIFLYSTVRRLKSKHSDPLLTCFA